MHNPKDTIEQLRRASLEIAIGFERMVKADRAEQVEALQEAAAALAEMRHCCEQEIVRLNHVDV